MREGERGKKWKEWMKVGREGRLKGDKFGTCEGEWEGREEGWKEGRKVRREKGKRRKEGREYLSKKFGNVGWREERKDIMNE